MNHGRSVVWNGVSYKSISEAAQAQGISRSTMSDRVRKGYQQDSDLKEWVQATPCCWNEKQYSSIRAMAEDLGIPHSTAKFRFKKGWTKDTDIPELRSPVDQLQELPNDISGINLTRGYMSIIDGADNDLAQYRWCASLKKRRGRLIYIQVQRNIYIEGRHHTEIMARVILARKLGRPLESNEIVDHVDGDPLNNRRDNLRLASTTQNRTNSKTGSNSKSGIKGVYQRANGRWKSRIKISGRDMHLGTFDTPEEAHEAYCKAAQEHFGEFARFE